MCRETWVGEGQESYLVKNPCEVLVLGNDAQVSNDASMFNFPCGVCGTGNHSPIFALLHSFTLTN